MVTYVNNNGGVRDAYNTLTIPLRFQQCFQLIDINSRFNICFSFVP